MTQNPDAFAASLRELSLLMVAEETLDSTLQRVVSMACMTIDGCEMASVTLERDNHARTVACTDKIALAIDEAQYAADAGPCLEAFRSGTVVSVSSTANEDRWPQFARAATNHGIHSSLSLPLRPREVPTGAFNLYSRAVDGFARADRELGLLFSEQAAVALANADVYWRTYDLTQNLQVALEIGRAHV